MTNKPGFYVATVRGVEGVRGVLCGDGLLYTPEEVGGSFIHRSDRHDTDLRPLVVLDPESDDWEALADAYMRAGGNVYDYLRAALRTLANPEPPLVEPNGIGAYVETADGGYTLGVDGNWRNEDGSIHQRYPLDPMGPAPLIYSHGHGCTCGGPDCPGGAS